MKSFRPSVLLFLAVGTFVLVSAQQKHFEKDGFMCQQGEVCGHCHCPDDRVWCPDGRVWCPDGRVRRPVWEEWKESPHLFPFRGIGGANRDANQDSILRLKWNILLSYSYYAFVTRMYHWNVTCFQWYKWCKKYAYTLICCFNQNIIVSDLILKYFFWSE